MLEEIMLIVLIILILLYVLSYLLSLKEESEGSEEDSKKVGEEAMEEKELKIITHYGVMPQLKYFQSEVFELNEAIIIYENERPHCDDEADDDYIKMLKKHIAEEIADVQVMLNQFRLYYGITDEEVKNIMIEKIDRQVRRIENEK